MDKPQFLAKLIAPDFREVAERGCYVYAYIRSKDSSKPELVAKGAVSGAPYYVGISETHDRPLVPHPRNRGPGVQVPKDRSRIRVMKSGLTREEACEWEMRFIAHYGCIHDETGILRNRTVGGDNGSKGFRHTEEHKAYLSRIYTGRKMSEESRQKMRVIGKARAAQVAAMARDPAVRAKITAAQTGQKRTTEQCQRIAEAKAKETTDATGFDPAFYLALPEAQQIAIRVRFEAGITDRETLLLPSHIRLDVIRSAEKLEMCPIAYSDAGKTAQGDFHKRYANWERSGKPKGITWPQWRDLHRNQCNALAKVHGTPWVDWGVSIWQWLEMDKNTKNLLAWRFKTGKRGGELLNGMELAA